MSKIHTQGLAFKDSKGESKGVGFNPPHREGWGGWRLFCQAPVITPKPF